MSSVSQFEVVSISRELIREVYSVIDNHIDATDGDNVMHVFHALVLQYLLGLKKEGHSVEELEDYVQHLGMSLLLNVNLLC